MAKVLSDDFGVCVFSGTRHVGAGALQSGHRRLHHPQLLWELLGLLWLLLGLTAAAGATTSALGCARGRSAEGCASCTGVPDGAEQMGTALPEKRGRKEERGDKIASFSSLLLLLHAQICFRSAVSHGEKADAQKREGRKWRGVMRTLPST